jgi:C1A family cysteine protease
MLSNVNNTYIISQRLCKITINTTTTLPSSFDWRVDNTTAVVTSVKDQGSVGTCWAFSTIGNIEGQNALKTNNLIDLSVEYLVDCDGRNDPT